MSTLKMDDFAKALARLENISKSQLFHTPSDSDPKAWAGSKEEDEDAFGDMIDENGTDYDGVKKALAAKVAKGVKLTPAETALAKGENPLPFVADKISKGQKLTKAESWAIKGGYMAMAKGEKPSEAGEPGEQKDASSVPASNAGGDEDEKDLEQEASKSLVDAADDSAILKSGLEVSPFLTEWARVQDISLRSNLSAVVKSVTSAVNAINARLETMEKAYAKTVAEDGEFKKALSEAIVGIGQQVQGTAELATQAAQLPARAPKSQMRSTATAGNGGVQPINKSFGGGNEERLSKSAVLEAMVDLVKSNSIHHLDVIKYETTEQMSPAVQQKVMAALNGGSR